MKRNRKFDTRLGVYLFYLTIFVLVWIFAILSFTSAFQHKPAIIEPHIRDQYLHGVFTAIFFAALGLLALYVVLADIHFELTGKWWMDIPLDIITFRNARWWEIPVGFFIAILLLLYSATTKSLIVPLPFSTSAGSAFGGSTSPEMLMVTNNALTQATLSASVAPIENAALMNFPIATLTSLLLFAIMGFGRKRIKDSVGIKTYRILVIPVALFVGFLAVQAHSLIYPPEVMQTTSISTFLFFSIGGLVSALRRSTLIWDSTHLLYNFGAVFFSIVTLSVSVFV